MEQPGLRVRPAPKSPSELQPVHSVEKVLTIVELLLRHGEALSAREVAELLDINRTTAHRLLISLLARGWVERDTGSSRYRMAIRYLVLSDLAYHQRDVLQTMRPSLERLSLIAREAVHVGVLDGCHIVHVEKVESPERVGVSSSIGARALAHGTSLGKAILAASGSGTVSSYLLQVQRYLKDTSELDAAWLDGEIRRTRVRGYSLDDEEDSLGVRCIGSAIMAGTGEPMFAVSITGPAGRFTMERAEACAPALMEVTKELSRRFGWDADVASSVPGKEAGGG
jgi:IclR family transcriptional regulator, KDG regulon repressor